MEIISLCRVHRRQGVHGPQDNLKSPLAINASFYQDG